MNIDFTGRVDRILFRNEENGYTVLSLFSDKEEYSLTCVGTFLFLSQGDYLTVSGEMVNHPIYGEQLKVSTYEHKKPDDLLSIERYLGSGAIKGIGEKMASRIVEMFGKDTFKIFGNQPEVLSKVRGISEKMARDFGTQFKEKQAMRDTIISLQNIGITGNLALKMFKRYGPEAIKVFNNNPYQIANDLDRVGFKTIDAIAIKSGISLNSQERIKSGVLYTLNLALQNGHMFLPYEDLVSYATELLTVESESVKKAINDLRYFNYLEQKKLSTCDDAIYYQKYYLTELAVARCLKDLARQIDVKDNQIETIINKVEEEQEIVLDDIQKQAVFEAAKNGLFILTGGPGTGKTTTINAIIGYFEAQRKEIILAAPTGRAAKRMSETCKREAKTIHRLLEPANSVENNNAIVFTKNSTNPIKADVIIIDEMSMVDIMLLNSLLSAIEIGTSVIFVGDENQLPSVGPGNVLHDIIASDYFSVIRLKKIFRQSEQSDIIINAHKINKGEKIDLATKNSDFFFLERNELNQVLGVLITLVKEKLPNFLGKDASIQVLTPMRKGELGTEKLNVVLQEHLNPKSKNKKEKESHGVTFREGDKVMQIKNNYQLEWEIVGKYNIVVNSGEGVFNGDMGIVKEINTFAEYVRVEFDDNRCVNYSYAQLEELELAYAVTVHKSQGSEYDAIVLPVLSGPKLLFCRNILYTAVTRAKRCVAIVGNDKLVYQMIDNDKENLRYSGLADWINELK